MEEMSVADGDGGDHQYITHGLWVHKASYSQAIWSERKRKDSAQIFKWEKSSL